MSGHTDFVLSVAYARAGDWLISGSKDRTVTFWDARTTKAHVMLHAHKNTIINLAFNAARSQVITAGGDCRARVWRFGG
jgi:glucose repression regulatory protein TUP1